jgi:hypothetical protein
MTFGNRNLRLLFAASALISAGAAFAQGRISSLEMLNNIQPGTTTVQQVRDLLGAPARNLRFPARGIEVLEYDARDYGRIVVSIAIGSDGKVRDITRVGASHP